LPLIAFGQGFVALLRILSLTVRVCVVRGTSARDFGGVSLLAVVVEQCTASPKGSQTRMGLASLFGTWLAQGLNPFSQCLALLTQPNPLG
jgi:hypothetical protein